MTSYSAATQPPHRRYELAAFQLIESHLNPASQGRTVGIRIVLDVPTGGMHVIGRFPGCRDDVALAASAQRGGLGPFALSSCAVGKSVDPGLLLSFTNIPVGAAAREVQRLVQTIRPLFGSSMKRR